MCFTLRGTLPVTYVYINQDSSPWITLLATVSCHWVSVNWQFLLQVDFLKMTQAWNSKTVMYIGQNILTHKVSKWQLDWNGLPPFAGGVWVKSTTSVSWVDVAVAVLVAADIKIRYITQVKKSKFNDPNEQLIISMTKISTQDITMMYSF